MNKETLRKSNEFLQVVEIADEVLQSPGFTRELIESMQVFHVQCKEILNNHIAEGKLTSYGIKSLFETFLTYWNESVGIETEIFWSKMQESGIKFTRKEPLRRALLKGRFRTVHEGMQAGVNFNSLVNSGLLDKQYSEKELNDIRKIIEKDAADRVQFLKECLLRKSIPSAKYLRYGDSLAYMNACQLWEKYFENTEVEELWKIWANFK